MKCWLSAALLCGLAASQLAQAEGVTLGTGFDYTSGKYGGSEKTNTLYIPFYVKYETGPAVFKLTVPYVSVNGPGNVVGVGGDRVTLPGGGGPRRTESGLGDIVGSAFYNVANERSAGVGIDLGVKVKLGTAERDKGLGTGETDYSLQADFFKAFGDTTAFGSIGHRWYGDPPGVNLKNVIYWSFGASHRVTSATSVGAAYDYRPAIISGGGEISELTGFVTQKVSEQWKLQPYALVGFGRASPDWGVGAQIAYSY